MKTLPQKNNNIICDIVYKKENIIINLQNRNSFFLNEDAHKVWEEIDGKRTSKDIINYLSSFYLTPKGTIKLIYNNLIKRLKKAGFINIV